MPGLETSAPASGLVEKPGSTANVVKAKKEPPQEDYASLKTRRQVISSFWLVVLLLGLPLWWVTTTVYRAELPLQEMNDWAAGKICIPEYPLTISITAPELQADELHNLQRSAQHALDDLNDFSAHHLRLSLPENIASQNDLNPNESSMNNAIAISPLTVDLILEKSATVPKAELRPHTKILEITYSPSMLPATASSTSLLSSFIAGQLQNLFAEEQALLWFLKPSGSTGPIKRLTPELSASLSKRTTRTLKYAPTYHLTFSLLTPEAFPSDWDIKQGLDNIFSPLLHALRPIHNFTIDTQVQPYSVLPPSIQPTFDESRKVWTLQEKYLGGFINTAEWPLSPSIGVAPTINFILYVAPTNQSPLLVGDGQSNSWLVPQWGGVAIHNGAAEYLSAEDLKPALLTFSNQLASLLGVPSTPKESLTLRLSTLVRVRAASVFFSASATMGSLARLVSNLPSISIPDSAADNVAATLHHLHAACGEFKSGRFEQALQHAKGAETHAEKAFFEKSMVGQAYFPEEHKVAVYLPLLGPVAVPLLVALIREVLSIVRSRRKRTEKAKTS